MGGGRSLSDWSRATFADRKRKFAELAAISRMGPQGGDGSGGLTVLRDEAEGVAESMEIALVTRMLDSGGGSGGRIQYKPKDLKEAKRVERYRAQSEQYLSMGLVDIAAACIDYRPNRFGSRYLTTHDAITIFERAFNSTSDFPNIFQNVLNKALLARYELHMPTYRELAVQRPFNDFRPHPQVRAGEFPLLQPVSETGEIKYGTSTDTGETVSVVPYGVIFSISRTMLVNDDLGAIDQILGSAGDTVLIFENTTFFNMLLSGTASVGPDLGAGWLGGVQHGNSCQLSCADLRRGAVDHHDRHRTSGSSRYEIDQRQLPECAAEHHPDRPGERNRCRSDGDLDHPDVDDLGQPVLGSAASRLGCEHQQQHRLPGDR